MTVKELIELLGKFPEHTEVLIWDSYGKGYMMGTESVQINDGKIVITNHYNEEYDEEDSE